MRCFVNLTFPKPTKRDSLPAVSHQFDFWYMNLQVVTHALSKLWNSETHKISQNLTWRVKNYRWSLANLSGFYNQSGFTLLDEETAYSTRWYHRWSLANSPVSLFQTKKLPDLRFILGHFLWGRDGFIEISSTRLMVQGSDSSKSLPSSGLELARSSLNRRYSAQWVEVPFAIWSRR